MTKENENLNIIQEKSSTKQSVASSKELTTIPELNQIDQIFTDLKNIPDLEIEKIEEDYDQALQYLKDRNEMDKKMVFTKPKV